MEAFLRSANPTHIVRGFGGIAAARKAATCIQGGRRSYYGSYGAGSGSDGSTYSLTTNATGTGKNAHVVVTKTQDWYQRQVKAKQALAQELRAVRTLRRGSVAPKLASPPAVEVIDLT